MTAIEFRSLKSQLALLSYTEQLTVIEYLAKLLQKTRAEAQENEVHKGVERIFTLMDNNPIYDSGTKWSRDELHER